MKIAVLAVVCTCTLLLAWTAAIGEGKDIDYPQTDDIDDYGDEGFEEYELYDDDDYYDDHGDNDREKRSWIYKCAEDECRNRCRKLLNLPDGQCGNAGKCYCRRKPKD